MKRSCSSLARVVGLLLLAVVALALTGAASATPPAPSFAPVVQLPSGGPFPYAVAIADLNDDSIPDMAVGNSGGGGAIGVLLGTGGGDLGPPVPHPSSIFFPASIATGDMDGDGDLDLVVSGLGGDVALLLGIGDGTFASSTVFSGATGVNSQLTGVGIADLNGDDMPDVVLADRNGDIYNGGKVVVMLGDGAGHLGAPTAFPTETQGPSAITVDDYNSDGAADVAISSVYSSAITVLLGNGAGGFGTATSYPTGGTYSYSVASGDVNGDGDPDLAASNILGAPVAVILGDGQGGFGPVTSLVGSGCCGTLAIALGDTNGDGLDDVAATILNNVQVWVSDGNGGFSAPSVFALGATTPSWAEPIKVTIGDASGDGLADVAVARNDWNDITGTVSLLVNATPIDTTPPTITTEGDITVNATSPAGANVTFTVTATDENPANPVVTCAPPSGSAFSIGDTQVVCSATDAADNTATKSFSVHVKGAPEQVADLIALVDRYNLRLLGTALHDKLVKVQEFLAANKPKRACEKLDSFLAQVKEQRGKRISVEQADRLTMDARRIKAVIGC